ncbi:hypothetical protein COO91_08052 [Nostoc flagelliforme CCNUN1]|uniref:Uncharacterized protein n=1 Tax=Nostoc flagelliforme CCNUN1 TaxID=2038116 RepID=A0A2K8T2S2_9NOSO|nr:hypothetical protein COO91_08052 [Nostoc flagelliforme CCNUN1]
MARLKSANVLFTRLSSLWKNVGYEAAMAQAPAFGIAN